MTDRKRFALIGAAGYIAPRHMAAIRDTGHDLVAVLDPNDSIGIIDSYFPEARYFREIEGLDRFVDQSSRSGKSVDYVSIASPNYLHEPHVRFALRSGAHAICEKPLVLNSRDIDSLREEEEKTGQRVYSILQLRLHPSIIELRKSIERALVKNPDKVFDVELTYLTSRGLWYFESWKGENAKSGGIATNIGVHFFDMLTWIFGDLISSEVHLAADSASAGVLRFQNAAVRWFLSVDYKYIPDAIKKKGQRTFRAILVEGDEIEVSGGFTDLHTLSYEEILKGNGFGLEDALQSIRIVEFIREAETSSVGKEYHPLVPEVLG